MKVVLDTNVLLMAIPIKSPFRPIFDALLSGKFTLCLSNEILSEYVEILTQKANKNVASNIADMLLSLENIEKIEVYYKWKLITRDDDDNKFVDCAIAAGATYLVSNDKHFNILKTIDFPIVNLLKIDEFLQIL